MRTCVANKMNDLCKAVTIVSGIIITGIFFPFLDFAYGESDFTLEAKVNYASDLDVTRFEISGESDKQICPSGQCTINLGEYTYFSAPTPDSMGISYTVDFKVHDNQANGNLGAKKKEFLEQFSASMIYCKIDDIIEENGQELYYCHDISNAISRIFDSKSWQYDTTGIYDVQNNMLKVYGNFTGSSPDSLDTTEALNTTNILNTTEAIKNPVEREKPRTYEDCYSENMGLLTLAIVFAPKKDISITDLLDPAWKNTIINMCNFFHEKTGIWVNMMKDTEMVDPYRPEFYQKYGNEMPEKLKQMIQEQGNNNK
jgi:hypothetical protein